jgi:HlyD family secretion protein
MNPSELPPNLDLEDSSEKIPQPEQKLKKTWLRILLALLLMGGAFGLWRMITPANKPSSVVAAPSPPVRPIETIVLKKGQGVKAVNLIGQVEASKVATIRSQTSGVVKQVLVREGDRLNQGMTVAILDDTDRVLALKEAQARLANELSNLARLQVGTRKEIIEQRRAALSAAQAREKEATDNLQRLENLVKEGAFSQRALVEAQSAVDSAKGQRLQAAAFLSEAIAGPIAEEIAAQKANVTAAEAAVNQARVELERTRIKAISDGVVQSKAVSVGDYLQNANPVITLVDSRELDIFLELPEELSGQINSGKRVILSSRALGDWQGQGTIAGVIPSVETASRRQRVRVRLNNPPLGLVSGMAVQGQLEVPSNTPSFLVSRDVLTRRQERWLIFTVANGKAKQMEVEIVADMGEQVAIYNQDLQEGQPIVIRGGDGLADGASVKIVGDKT